MKPSQPRAGGADTPKAASGQMHLGPDLRRAWVGYQQRLDNAMAAAGFHDRGFPDGRVLRICRDRPGCTTSQIARELEITRQGAGKIVHRLIDLGYAEVVPSETNGREKVVRLTPRGFEYLAAQRTAARAIEQEVARELGSEGFESLHALLALLAGGESTRLRAYLRGRTFEGE